MSLLIKKIPITRLKGIHCSTKGWIFYQLQKRALAMIKNRCQTAVKDWRFL